ncbi:MAG: non-hydrolyzing UDP-N-acetylglucosamine 2-epimerase [Bacteroidota bacterium]
MNNKILIVVGTRPNFIKITRFKKVNAAMGNPFDIKIVHTGQHYDSKMADVFFTQFELEPDYYLNIPQASANTQIGEIIIRLEKVIEEFDPACVVAVGDVNSTFAAAFAGHKLNRTVAHLESGLRSYDRSMPEEINRLLTDEISDYFFVTEQSGYDNLIKEGKNKDAIIFVGNTMIDTLVEFENKIQESTILNEYGLQEKGYVLMTMHRPATVDSEDGLKKLLDIIEYVNKQHYLVFPIHPRTLSRLQQFGLMERVKSNPKIILTEPLDYFAFQKLIAGCNFVITDSGGIQEETTFRGVPCLTLRPNTERPSTVWIGTNELVPFEIDLVQDKINEINTDTFKKGSVPPMWDGHSTERILDAFKTILKM